MPKSRFTAQISVFELQTPIFNSILSIELNALKLTSLFPQKDRYKIVEPEVMGSDIYNKVISALKKTKSAA